MDINESPVYMLLNPAINHAQKDLPITIYESGKLTTISLCFVKLNVIRHARLNLILQNYMLLMECRH